MKSAPPATWSADINQITGKPDFHRIHFEKHATQNTTEKLQLKQKKIKETVYRDMMIWKTLNSQTFMKLQ